MAKLYVFIFCSILGLTLSANRKSYEGHQVWEVLPKTRADANLLSYLEAMDGIILWNDAVARLPVEMLVAPKLLKTVRNTLKKHGIEYSISVENIESYLNTEFQRMDRKRLSEQFAFDYNDYNTLEEIYTELDAVVSSCPSSLLCETYNIGNSYEGRPLRVLRVSLANAPEDRPIYWLDSLIHAREWLAGASVLKIMNFLITNYGTDAIATELLDKYDFHFLPVMNPDGYVWSWESDRFWRKSRNLNQGSNCIGTDLNRNYDINWGGVGTSPNPCSDTYHGASAASEPETQAVQTESNRLSSRVKAWISTHTAAQMYLHPWGHTENGRCARAPTHDLLFRVANAAADATEETYGTVWTRGNSCETIYATTGSTHDYVYGVANIAYSYTPELRGPGFNPPASEIVPSFNEFWNGVKALIAEIEAIESEKL